VRLRRRVEPVGYLYPGVAVFVASHADSLYQQLRKLAALLKRLLSALFELLHTLPERHKPRLGALGDLDASAPAFEFVLDGP
jgi:hypothetical protein